MASSPRWPRPHWQAHAGADALLLFFVFGDFPRKLEVALDRYRSRGLPDGVQLYRHPHEQLRQWDGYPLGGALGRVLRAEQPAAVQRAETAAEVLSVRGSVVDPASLDYLLDSIGVVAGLLDLGGTTVVDPQTLSLFDADEWRARFTGKQLPPPRSHVLILANPDEAGGQWIHTRGMRKFGRDDIGVRKVPQAQAEQAGALCQKLVELQAQGMRLEQGQPLQVDGLPQPLPVQRDDNAEDPRYNNSHVELVWPDVAAQ